MKKDVFEIETRLAAAADEVWQSATSPEGIGYELSPWLKMTFPKRVAALTPETVPIGRKICRSWILLFGLIPVDYDDVTLVALEPPRRFLEVSPMLFFAYWSHERTVTPAEGGCAIKDRLTFAPRLGAFAPFARRIVSFLFTHRHARLAARFGRVPRP